MPPPSELIERKLPTVPDLPGAYIMRDEAGEILYVGKARSLRRRLRQHFRENAAIYGWTQQLYARAHDIEYTVTETELEAFILEANLIKEHKPRYNIRLTDDKSYPYLKLTEELYPRLMVLRDLPKSARVVRPGRPGARRFHDPKRHEVHGAAGRLFGPYPDARSMWRVLRLVPQIFGLRSCRRALDGTPNGKPCLNFHIGRCVGPCRGVEAVSREEYEEIVRETERFLDGRTDDILRDLEAQMQAASADLQFERAAKLRDKIRAIRRATEEQVMVATEGRDQDVLGVALAGDRAMVVLFEVRAGRLVKQDQFVFGRVKGRSGAEVLDAFLTQHYAQAEFVPSEVLLSEDAPDMGEWEELLSEARGTKVRVHRPQRGEKRRLAELAVKNAQLGLAALGKTRAEQQRAAQQSLADLAEALCLPAHPKRIECFDISTTQGRDSVGSQVVFTDGVPDKKAYRRYRMRATEGKPDDFAMMAEMIRRRLRRGLAGDEKFLPLPDLILVDGGKGQLSTAVEVLREEALAPAPSPRPQPPEAPPEAMQVTPARPPNARTSRQKGPETLAVPQPADLGSIAIAGLAKQEEEVFVPGHSEPVDMDQHPTGQFLLQRIRDEAHRFAITHHRGLRDSQMTRSALDDAPGIGPTRRRELLRAFPSVQAMAHATVDELAAVKGMSRPAAEALLRFLTRVKDEGEG